MREILEAHTPPANGLGAGHKGLYDTINNSLHFQLGLALASVGTPHLWLSNLGHSSSNR
jgi:photosystem I P700 chlorophyll a apoprotein A2